jgi:hypothetical protein
MSVPDPRVSQSERWTPTIISRGAEGEATFPGLPPEAREWVDDELRDTLREQVKRYESDLRELADD